MGSWDVWVSGLSGGGGKWGSGGVGEMRKDEDVGIERSKTIDDADADADI